MKIEIFDSTLRDGVQGESISYSVTDKINIVKALDNLGIDYIEVGNPSSNPKDIALFSELKKVALKNSKIVAFGATHRKGSAPKDDLNCKALLDADTEVVAIFGKSWSLHAEEVLQVSLEENLDMIKDTITFFKEKGKKVFFDSEHFFDGFKDNAEYALKTLSVAEESGADRIILCDTNGGCFPDEIASVIRMVKEKISVPLGIHCHNDSGCAVANSLSAVKSGCIQIQGTYLGYGERCGNANLSTIIPNLQLKLGYSCIPDENLSALTETANRVAELSNHSLKRDLPYVGRSAFSHKAGMHIDGVSKLSKSFEHITPTVVGNERRFLISEFAGRSTILNKITRIAPELTKESPQIQAICDEIKRLENEGFSFEAADASFELLVMRILNRRKSHFKLDYFKTFVDEPSHDTFSASATIKVTVGDRTEITAEEGEGPVHALDKALRRALSVFYPQLENIRLTDYKVRVLEPQLATAAKVRVLIETSDEKGSWSTVGVSSDVIDASWQALVEAIEYKLMKDEEIKK